MSMLIFGRTKGGANIGVWGRVHMSFFFSCTENPGVGRGVRLSLSLSVVSFFTGPAVQAELPIPNQTKFSMASRKTCQTSQEPCTTAPQWIFTANFQHEQFQFASESRRTKQETSGMGKGQPTGEKSVKEKQRKLPDCSDLKKVNATILLDAFHRQ